MRPIRGNTARAYSRDNPQDDERSNAREGDPYHAYAKLPEPPVCPSCKAVYADGRWGWRPIPGDANQAECPACLRIHDKFPAGYVMVKGAFFAEHRDEIVALITAKEKREKATHPLQRIMAIEEVREGLQISTTDSQLARGIGEALHDAYKGELKLRYSRDENLLRASWKR